MKSPTVSIVLCCYNEEKYLSGCLEDLKNQTFIDYEVVVVDDGSKDKTVEVANKFKKQFKNFKVVKQKHAGLGTARNNGVKNSKGKIIFFHDADMRLDKEYIKTMIKPILKENVKGTTHGQEYATNLDNPWARCWGRIRVLPTIKERIPHNYRCIQKKVFEKAAGFDPSWGYADDQSLTAKIGNAKLVDNAIAYHNNPTTLNETYLQARWIGGSYKVKYHLMALIFLFLAAFMTTVIFTEDFLFSFKIFGSIAVALFLIYIIYMTLKKTYRENNMTLLYLYPIFMTVRLYGSLAGVLRQFGQASHLQ